ncbi:MAG: glycoside hydrolase family 3 protein [Spirochaetales bacterium]|nr:glycoside hydrolase family 3 protein [Spirochaetales bacterium]
MKKFTLLSFIFTILCSNAFSLNFFDNEPAEILAEKIVEEMTPEEMLGQLLMLTFQGTRPDNYFKRWITERKLGGVKIFGWNGKDAMQLGENIGNLQDLAAKQRFSIPLFISTDQEGGWVRHVSDRTIETPGNMALGAGNKIEDAYLAGYYIAKELSILGINMNFAPTVDIMYNTDSRIIGTRAFSADPYVTSHMAIAFFKGHEKFSVISTAKHFPGHGRCAEDSHGKLPSILADFPTLLETDLIPYKFLINENIPMIMSGHISYPNITQTNDPASLSPFILKKVLRDDLGFKGVIITDDLLMHGATKKGVSENDIPIEALRSGNDIILMSYNEKLYDYTWKKALDLYYKDNDFQKSIKESAKRVILLKLNYLKKDNSVTLSPDPKEIEEKLPLKEAEDFIVTNTSRSITVLKKELTPKPDDKILLVGRYKAFFQEGLDQFPNSGKYFFLKQYTEAGKDSIYREINKIADKYDTIIFEISDTDMLDIAQRLENFHHKMILITTSNVATIKRANFTPTTIAIYSINNLSFRAGFQVLNGNFTGQGVLVF